MSLIDEFEPMDEGQKAFEHELGKALGSLLTYQNLDLKTELNNPLNMTKLETLQHWLKESDFDNDKLFNVFISKYRRNMVSHKRQGRKEMVQAISEFIKMRRSRLFGAPQDQPPR